MNIKVNLFFFQLIIFRLKKYSLKLINFGMNYLLNY